ncbi:MAG: glycosyltransferase family 9 protein [bacterium]
MSPDSTADSPRILVLLLGLIGDTLMRVPAVRALREEYPAARIVALATPVVAPALEINPLFDEVLVFDRRRLSLWQQARFYRSLRQRRFDMTIDFYYGARTPFLAWCTGARRRIGPARDGMARRLLTDPTPFPLEPIHMVDRHLAILRPLGISGGARRWEFPVSAAVQEELTEVLTGAGVDPLPQAGDFVVTAGAGDVSKRWDDELLRQFMQRVVARELGVARRVFIVTDQRDPELVAQWSGIDGTVIVPCLTLPQLGALFTRVDLALVPDTGPMHIALATAPRLLTFFQSTDPEIHNAERPGYAYLYRHVCRYQPCDTRDKDKCELECRRSLSVEAMLEAARVLLAGAAWDGEWEGSRGCR